MKNGIHKSVITAMQSGYARSPSNIPTPCLIISPGKPRYDSVEKSVARMLRPTANQGMRRPPTKKSSVVFCFRPNHTAMPKVEAMYKTTAT